MTDEHKKLVEDNHNLIYWYCNLKHLDVEEYYDLLAIELCKSAVKFNSDKSSFSTFFKVNADNMLINEYVKTKRQKRIHYDGEYEESKNEDVTKTEDILLLLSLEQVLGKEDFYIMRMKIDGLTQNEIAMSLGVSQSYVSQSIKRIRKELKTIDR